MRCPVGSLLVVSLALVLLGHSGVTRAQDATPELSAGTPVAAGAEVVWQIEGGPDLRFDDPFQLAIDPDGNLWVADANKSRFQIFAPDGTFLDVWGTPGSGEGEFDFLEPGLDPTGAVAFDDERNIYVLDAANDRVQKFDQDREFLLAWGETGTGDGQFVHPYDIAVDANGRVYVFDDGRDDIQVFDGDGRLLTTIGEQGRDRGQLYDTGSLAIAADGTVWVADWGNNRVQAFAPDGAFRSVVGGPGTAEGEFIGPLDVAVDADGRVYVTECCNYRVQVFAKDGAYLTQFGGYGLGAGELIQPGGIAVDEAGDIYVSDGGTDRVTKFRLLPLAPRGTPIP